ncbi:MAG: hypothetical protein ACKVS9_18860 [Phycisphaerae bacterium]
MLESSLILVLIGGIATMLVLHTFAETKRGCSSMLSFYANLLADVRRNRAEQHAADADAI